ncbi:MAG: hypothetical protein UZ14_CFX002002829 [Chloroflexi bacterium OLB14]|nr:MAG: hypothetical protein UZ14_CFX002002829 [Chloroflexi bacterium OLB14]
MMSVRSIEVLGSTSLFKVQNLNAKNVKERILPKDI